MKTIWVAAALLLLHAKLLPAQTVINFDQGRRMPAGWETGITGKGTNKWEIVAEGSAPSQPNALQQSGEATFAWAARTGDRICDGFAQVQLKPIAGRKDQAGGIVFRFQDANNYYVVRANALENNVVLYKTIDGKRSALQIQGRSSGYGLETPVPCGQWSRLRVEFRGPLFTVFFQGKELFRVEDGTLREAGAVGLWTKADSTTLFDDFNYGAAAEAKETGGVHPSSPPDPVTRQ